MDLSVRNPYGRTNSLGMYICPVDWHMAGQNVQKWLYIRRKCDWTGQVNVKFNFKTQ